MVRTGGGAGGRASARSDSRARSAANSGAALEAGRAVSCSAGRESVDPDGTLAGPQHVNAVEK